MIQRAKKYSVSDLHYSAEINKGKCLSKEYINFYTAVEWRCEKGHRFALAHQFVRQGAWCPQCEKESIKQDKLDKLIELAKSKNGELLSKTYINWNTKYKWKCNKGHSFNSEYRHIKNWNFCKTCTTIKRQNKAVAAIKKVLEKKQAKYLSNVYINSKTKIKIKCVNNHIFTAQAIHIQYQHSWCPYCSRKAKHTIKSLNKFAKLKNGKCLSTEYHNSFSLLTWQCKEKHIWKNSTSHILDGEWCPECRKTFLSEKFRTDIKVIQKLARDRGGYLLSKNYTNANIHLQWQCDKGHKWLARYGQVRHGNWCPICALEKRRQGIIKSWQKRKALEKDLE